MHFQFWVTLSDLWHMTEIYYTKIICNDNLAGKENANATENEYFGLRRFDRVAPWKWNTNSMAQRALNSHLTQRCKVDAQFFSLAGATWRHACTEQALNLITSRSLCSRPSIWGDPTSSIVPEAYIKANMWPHVTGSPRMIGMQRPGATTACMQCNTKSPSTEDGSITT